MPRTCPDCGWVWPNPRGVCPRCGSDAAPEVDLAGRETRAVATPASRPPVTLVILAVAFAIYLGWRIVQGVAWLVAKF
ncbi:MAG: hypothetical protein IT198_03575 [Acidimicrobiia bacterium]|nr:hypothetical protein [Acidimicrobiia bacterium]